jgi:hypothetical protein
MTRGEIVNAVINGLVAIGTLAVAVAAIWGDWLRSFVAAPKLRLIPHNDLRGTL